MGCGQCQLKELLQDKMVREVVNQVIPKKTDDQQQSQQQQQQQNVNKQPDNTENKVNTPQHDILQRPPTQNTHHDINEELQTTPNLNQQLITKIQQQLPKHTITLFELLSNKKKTLHEDTAYQYFMDQNYLLCGKIQTFILNKSVISNNLSLFQFNCTCNLIHNANQQAYKVVYSKQIVVKQQLQTYKNQINQIKHNTTELNQLLSRYKNQFVVRQNYKTQLEQCNQLQQQLALMRELKQLSNELIKLFIKHDHKKRFKLSQNDLKKYECIQQLFSQADENITSFLEPNEFKVFIELYNTQQQLKQQQELEQQQKLKQQQELEEQQQLKQKQELEKEQLLKQQQQIEKELLLKQQLKQQQQQFAEIDKNKDGKLSYDEVKQQFLNKLNIGNNVLQKLFKLADASGDGYLQQQEFQKFNEMISNYKSQEITVQAKDQKKDQKNKNSNEKKHEKSEDSDSKKHGHDEKSDDKHHAQSKNNKITENKPEEKVNSTNNQQQASHNTDELKQIPIDAQTAFTVFDQNNDGKISFDEVKKQLIVKNYVIQEKTLKSLFNLADASGDGYLQPKEFTAFQKLIQTSEMFTLVDVDHDNKVSWPEAQKYFNARSDCTLGTNQLRVLFKLADISGDGFLQKTEFEKFTMMIFNQQ